MEGVLLNFYNDRTISGAKRQDFAAQVKRVDRLGAAGPKLYRVTNSLGQALQTRAKAVPRRLSPGFKKLFKIAFQSSFEVEVRQAKIAFFFIVTTVMIAILIILTAPGVSGSWSGSV
jgi:hypothetical protein